MKSGNQIYTTLIFWVCLIATVSTWAQKPAIKFMRQEKYVPNDDDELNISLRIEQTYNRYSKITRQEYFYPDQKNELRSDRKRIHSYDSRGRHLNTLEYNKDNILEFEKKIIWDSKGNKTRVENTEYSDGQQARVSVSYKLEYYDNGNKKNEQYFDSNGKTIRNKVWHYNRENEVIRSESWVNLKNKPKKEIKIRYSRDRNGNLLRSVSIEKINQSIYRKDVRIFNNNFVIRWKKYIKGRLESVFINEYRDSVIIRTTKRNKRKITPISPEKKVKKSKRNTKEEIWVTNSEYDAYGNIVITTQSVDNEVIHVSQYEYDDYGNCIKKVEVDKIKNLKTEEQFEYDDYGNIAKKTLFKNDKIASREEFVYEYFERR